ncbi:DUF2971 domain-containing protein [Clostridium felsineum]|uniref:Uncharacterized protein n=1 Tax=Clostridium felsineum TaxID=36839 RepID=A0A1S8LS79_9CLOT|nr:DUF2971 domain-containing protein [Clostridium felsineum]MCR3758336.1 DUF2971 domain-containing protein [Clostridium felsineum]URZ03689.1 hypothetical protein CLAUR_037500 [Clostridium felsineum]URZ07998.1 hypothetical protein CLROS_033640 [Clostridium felsineum]URZ13029.1 hypothetical protein CROST_037790 [Clostridium felsineum]URZ14981.1 hypothetical protein CLFE_009940 [Clostridium felsineum DSM 794]
MEWIDEFIKLLFDGRKDEAYKLKYRNFPKKLYKYEIIDENRLSALKDNKIWFANPDKFNDPFDSCGVFFDKAVLSNYTNKVSIEDYINGLRNNIKICCFSEELNSMPMWAHYANNHTGICIQYNFFDLNYMNKFSKYIIPIRYETEKYDITKFLERVFKDDGEDRMYLLFFLMQIKHVSWSYEKEWRIILKAHKDKNSGIICPIKPEGIYLGLNCSEENKEKIKNITKEYIHCPVYEVEKKEGKLFEFNNKDIST